MKGIVAGWTIETLAYHGEALLEAEAKFQAERDRRYTEVALEREKALKIKETADLAALQLAREIQTYKDEKANELREQISSERGMYATKGDLSAAMEKVEAVLKPLVEGAAADRGKGAGVQLSSSVVLGAVSLLTGLILIGSFVFTRSAVAPAAPQVIYVPAPPGAMLPATPPTPVPR